MNEQEKNFMWRMKAIELAVTEQLNKTPVLIWNLIILRGKDLYEEGINNGILDWDSTPTNPMTIKEETEERKPTENMGERGLREIAEKEIKLKPGHKICPSCNEQCPEGWPNHNYKIDGSVCGHTF